MQTNIPPPNISPAISVIIPMYNVEEYIAECLDSLLNQTFQDFEVIVVDDCSTDNSVEVVKSYVEKFNGRLKFAIAKKNSGGGSKPRNFGLKVASGEYIFFVDSDDFIMLNTIETLYNAAKEYDAEVVYYAAHYDLRKPNDIYLHRDGLSRKLLKEGLEDKPTLTVNDNDKILHELLLVEEGNLCGPCTKFIRRDFLLKNGIVFPDIAIGEDFIWCINVYCHAKRFLRLPVSLYFYRRYNTKSVSQTKREPAEQISRWVTKFVAWLRFLSELESKNEILSKNPVYCLAASKRHFQWSLGFMNEARKQLSDEEIYEILFNEFAKENDSPNLTIPFFFSVIHADKKAYENYRQKFRSVINKFTSRIDLKFVPKNKTGDFQILSLSDDKADVFEPAWLQKGGKGYQIQSYDGHIEIVAKANADGQIRLNLLAMDVRNPKDYSKRIPCWVDYTKLTVNGKTIFDSIISAWHDKSYNYLMDVKADEEITLQVEWLPHRTLSVSSTVNKLRETIDDSTLLVGKENNPAISIIIPVYNAEKFIGELLDSLFVQTFQNFEVIVVDDCSKDSSCEVIESYIPKFDGRLSLYHMSRNSGSAPAPRNNGFLVSRGEYIFFMDSDDTLTKTALEEMYTLAKEYDADVVYCEKYYMSTGVGEEYIKNIHLADNRIQKSPFVQEPTLISDKLSDRLDDLLAERFWVTPWQRLVSRKLLAENEINFPEIIGCDDVVWCFLVLCFSKKFLRVPNICYVRRMYDESFTQSSKKSPNKHIHQWLDITVRGIKFVNKYMERLKFFRENLDYRYKALNLLASTPFGVVAPVCSNLSSEEIYDIFMTEFTKDTGDNNVLVSLLFTRLLDGIRGKTAPAKRPNPNEYSHKKILLTAEQQEAINQLKAKIEDFLSSEKVLPVLSSTTPAISVVIPLYNTEELVAECLNSLLVQTFTDYEVIVVDDCSTDNSCAIVESYAEKFDGRLKLVHTEKNSGGGGYVPRNIGLELASGEYIYFMDADDFILDNTLETLYTAAKEHDADVVYSGSYYEMDTPEYIYIRQDDETRKLIADGLEDKPNLRVNEPNKNLSKLLLEGNEGNFRAPWSKFICRQFLIENKIIFPEQITNGGDFIWVINVYCHSKRFLRILTPLYFYRRYNTKSVSQAKKKPAEQITHWISAFIDFVQYLRALENETEILSENPAYCKAALNAHFGWCLNRTAEARNSLRTQEIYEVLHDEFGKDSSDVTVPFFFSTIDEKQKEVEEIKRKFKPFFNKTTARIDIQLVPKTETGDFQIISVSDDNADVLKPAWFQKGGIGYQIQSHKGKIEIVAKATADGQIRLNLRGLDIRDPLNTAKRIPCWIDYTNLTVNGKTIFNKPTPAWHDKPYSYYPNVKAGDKIVVKLEWLPHQSDILPSVPKEESIVKKFLPYITARLDVYLESKGRGDFKILSISDNKADILKPDWIQKKGIGYQIQSHNGKMEIVAKATGEGQVKLRLLGLDIRRQDDKSKRVPYWIDYTKLTVNGKKIFDKVTPVWHDKPYIYNMDVKADEEIKVQVEWLPHSSENLSTSTSEAAEIIRKFSNYITAKILVRMDKKIGEENLQIISVSDKNAELSRPEYWQKSGICHMIDSHKGKLKIIAKAAGDGQVQVQLKGPWVPNPKNKSKLIPYWIDYTKLIVNGETVFNKPTPVWHDKPYIYNMDAKTDEEITIQTEWLPHRSDAELLPKANAPAISHNFSYYITAKLFVQMYKKPEPKNLQIVSVSDSGAKVSKPEAWQRFGNCYMIDSYFGQLEIVAKANDDGQVRVLLAGPWALDPEDKSKKIPYWIDYTKLTVNGKLIFDKVTPAWHDKNYIYSIDVKAGDEIKIQTEWLPHKAIT